MVIGTRNALTAAANGNRAFRIPRRNSLYFPFPHRQLQLYIPSWTYVPLVDGLAPTIRTMDLDCARMIIWKLLIRTVDRTVDVLREWI